MFPYEVKHTFTFDYGIQILGFSTSWVNTYVYTRACAQMFIEAYY